MPDPAKAFRELSRAMELCWANRLVLPTLTLLYSGIDTLAWLSCPPDQNYVSRSDFVDWVERFLLPESGLHCTSLELYAARCGLLHTATPDARLTRKGAARQLYYVHGPEPERCTLLDLAIQQSGESALAVQVETLLGAFQNAVERFVDSVEPGTEAAAALEARLQRVFTTV